MADDLRSAPHAGAARSRGEASRGKVEADAFRRGRRSKWSSRRRRCAREPSPDAPLDTEALQGRARHGLRDQRGRLGLGPARQRRLCRLAAGGRAGDARAGADAQGHARCARWRFPGPSIKLPPVETLPLGARLAIARDRGRFAVTARRFVPAQHLRRSTHGETDFVAVAERFLGTPYLWGGKTSLGLDCSGLVQVALTACGIACPRDSDMQERGARPALDAPSSPAIAARRPHVLERPRRHRARRRDASSTPTPSTWRRDRADRETRSRASAPAAARSQAIRRL